MYHVFLAFGLVGHIAEQINLAALEHLEQIRPAIRNIFICPAGVCRDPLMVFVVHTAEPAELVVIAEGGVEPSDTHDLLLLLRRRCRDRQQQIGKHDNRQERCQQPSDRLCLYILICSQCIKPPRTHPASLPVRSAVPLSHIVFPVQPVWRDARSCLPAWSDQYPRQRRSPSWQ